MQLLKKIPFRLYCLRLWRFIIAPEIQRTPLETNELRFAFADNFTSLAVIASIYTLARSIWPDIFFVNSLKILNPFYVVVSSIIFGAIFCIIMSISYILLFIAINRPPVNSLKNNFYLLILHCARFYSLVLLTSGLYGLFAFDEMVRFFHIFESRPSPIFPLIWLVISFFIFRVLVVPLSDFLPIYRNKQLARALTSIIFLFSILNLFYPSDSITHKTLNTNEFTKAISKKMITSLRSKE